MSNETITCFYVEKGRAHYGPFDTVDAARAYADKLGFGLELALGLVTINQYRGRLLSSEQITEEDFKRLGREGIPQPDGSIVWHVEAEG